MMPMIADMEAEAPGLRFELAWPDKKLSPNARMHWRPKAEAVKRARWDASYAVLEAAGGSLSAIRAALAGDVRIPLRVAFYPPDARHRDDDNLVSSFKASRDGIADALGVNDRRFLPEYYFEAPEKPGRVQVSIYVDNPKYFAATESDAVNGSSSQAEAA